MAETLSAHRVGLGVIHDGLGLAHPRGALLGVVQLVLLGDLVQADDRLGEAARKLLRIRAHDGLQDVDGRHESVRGGGDGGELCVVLSDALVRVHEQLDVLPRAHLGDQDVRMTAAHLVGAEPLRLLLPRLEDDVPGVHAVVLVQLVGIRDALLGLLQAARFPPALEVEREADAVLVRLGLVVGEVLVLVVPGQPAEGVAAAAEGDQAEAVGEDFVLDDGGVLVDVDVFDGEGGDLGDEDAAEGVGERGVDAGEGEGQVELGALVGELDVRALGVGV